MVSPIARLPNVEQLFGFTAPTSSGAGRNSSGQFAIQWPDVAAINKKMAQRVQASVVSAFKASLSERPQRSTRYLQKALESDEAIAANLEGFAFLPAGYLDQPQTTKYWRNLEEGTSKFEGRVLRGYFVTGDVFTAPTGKRRGVDERFAGRDGSAKSGRGAVITRPIKAHDFLKDGVSNWRNETGITPLTSALKVIRISPL